MTDSKKMPILFVGHGSPMNAIEDNIYTKGWENIVEKIPQPKAILAISAHWYTPGIRINDTAEPKQVYDMYGFPKALYRLKYPAKGASATAEQVKDLIGDDLQVDNGWGIDHGTWAVLCRMYPKADVPICQLSVNKQLGANEHFVLGQKLRQLRENGVLLFASGNIVHNLGEVNWNMEKGHAWASAFDGYIKDKIKRQQYDAVIDYKSAGASADKAFVLPDHFYPLLYILGAADNGDELHIFNDSCTLGSLSMTSYLFS
jgi:4,5-DOPA dioxygenase extradiol